MMILPPRSKITSADMPYAINYKSCLCYLHQADALSLGSMLPLHDSSIQANTHPQHKIYKCYPSSFSCTNDLTSLIKGIFIHRHSSTARVLNTAYNNDQQVTKDLTSPLQIFYIQSQLLSKQPDHVQVTKPSKPTPTKLCPSCSRVPLTAR